MNINISSETKYQAKKKTFRCCGCGRIGKPVWYENNNSEKVMIRKCQCGSRTGRKENPNDRVIRFGCFKRTNYEWRRARRTAIALKHRTWVSDFFEQNFSQNQEQGASIRLNFQLDMGHFCRTGTE